MRNGIPNAIFILILANQKVFLKNQDLILSSIKKDAMTIPKVLNLEPLNTNFSYPDVKA